MSQGTTTGGSAATALPESGLGLLGLVLAADHASGTYSETSWGSLPKSAATYSTKQVEGVHSGQHTGFDRLVVDIGAVGLFEVGYDVRYVDAMTDADGHPVALRGDATIQVTVQAPAYDDAGEPTYVPTDGTELVPVGSYATFEQAAWAGSLRGQTTLGLGVRTRLPMRAFLLPDGDGTRRFVVDVAHAW